MPRVTFVQANGSKEVLDVPVSDSVMRAAKSHGLAGIEADCGGVCACATCHVYVDPAWTSRVGEADKDEREMLECANNVNEYSRLSCQIAVEESLDGLIIHLPESQR